MTIYQGEGKGAAHTIEQKEIFVQLRVWRYAGEGALQAGFAPWVAVRAPGRCAAPSPACFYDRNDVSYSLSRYVR